MQNTRLNRLVDGSLTQFSTWILNPWRRTSLIVISLLFGNFLATAFSTITGQNADWDVLIAAILTSITETISWFVYRVDRVDRPSSAEPRRPRPLVPQLVNALKIGLIYGLFVESFKLGS